MSSSRSSKNVPSQFRMFLAVLPLILSPSLPKWLGAFKQSYSVNLLALVALLFPSSVLCHVVINSRQEPYFYTKVGILVVLVGVIAFSLAKRLKKAAQISRSWRDHRQDAFEEAMKLVSERIDAERVLPRHGYDLYLPPPPMLQRKSGTAGNRTRVPAGFVLLPGALVEYNAYGPVAADLSDRGILVALIHVEPLRIAADHLGASAGDIKRVVNDVTKHVLVPGDAQDPKSRGIDVSEWTIGGHSLGGTVACQLVIKLGFPKLVLWGCSMMMDDLSGASVDVLAVHASEDGFLFKIHNKEKFLSMLPCAAKGTGNSKTTCFMIEGGNHAGFGYYGPQTFPRRDGERKISLKEQQKTLGKVTADFILQTKDVKKD